MKSELKLVTKKHIKPEKHTKLLGYKEVKAIRCGRFLEDFPHYFLPLNQEFKPYSIMLLVEDFARITVMIKMEKIQQNKKRPMFWRAEPSAGETLNPSQLHAAIHQVVCQALSLIILVFPKVMCEGGWRTSFAFYKEMIYERCLCSMWIRYILQSLV